MNQNKHEHKQRSVILRIDAGSFSLSTIELAVQMAASADSRLHTMFIEDEDLLHAVGLPCSRVISFSTAQERPTDPVQMQRSLHSMAKKIRKTLQQATQGSQIAWSFDVIRGHRLDIDLSPELDVVFTILAQSTSPRVVSRRFKRRRRILLLDNQSANLGQALRVVLQNFARDQVEIIHIKPLDQQTHPPTADLLQHIEQLGGWVSLVDLEHDQLTALLSEPDRIFDCAIISCLEDSDSLRNILTKLKCPVVLVS